MFDADYGGGAGLAGERVILVREETKPEDIHGFFQAQGILTSRGGKTSHAAVVARGMGKPCVSGCEQIVINDKARSATIGETTLHEGDVITIDGGTGHVYAGEVPTVEAKFSDEMVTLLAWADEVARLKVMANADTPEDAIRARQFGAMGIGLVRTERMFNSTDRLPIVQEMILAETHGGAPGGARPPAADPARRLQGHLQGDEGAARHGAPARPADARIPADRGAARTRDRAPAPAERQHQGR